LALLQ